MKIADVVTQEAISIRRTTKLGVGFRTPQGIPIVVTDDVGRPVGLIPGGACDARNGHIPPGAWHPSMLGAPSTSVAAGELMSAPPPIVSEDETIAKAARLFLREGVRQILVCDTFGRAIGWVDREELAVNRQRHPRQVRHPLRHGERALGDNP